MNTPALSPLLLRVGMEQKKIHCHDPVFFQPSLVDLRYLLSGEERELIDTGESLWKETNFLCYGIQNMAPHCGACTYLSAWTQHQVH